MAHASCIAEPLEQRQLLAFVNTANELTKISNVVGEELVAAGNLFFFLEQQPDHTRKVWRSDGTTAGTFRVSDVNQGANVSGVFPQFAVFGDRVFFAADDGVNGVELWTSDGTTAGTRMVADINPGSASSNPANLAAADGRVYFAADNGTLGREPWSADVNGGTLLADVRPGATGSNPTDFFTVNDTVLFFGKETTRFLNLYGSVNQAAPTALARFPEFTEGPFDATIVGDRAYFIVAMYASGAPGTFIWYTDGTSLGTRRITRPVWPGAINPSRQFNPIAFGDQLIFRGFDSAHGWEPWTTDGTESGTQLINDINPGIGDGLPHYGEKIFVQLGDKLLFNADDGVTGRELWSTDGTQFNTRLLRDLTVNGNTFPRAFGGTGDSIFFGADSSRIGLTNGSATGTVILGYNMRLQKDPPVARGNEVFMLTNQGFYRVAGVDNISPVVNAVTMNHNAPVSATVQFSEDIRDSLSFEAIVVKNVESGARLELAPQDVVWDATLGRSVTITFNSYFPNLPDGNYRLSIPAGAVQDVWGNASQSDWSIDFFALLADFNRDRWIDSRDFSVFASTFNQTIGFGDFNRSGRIDIADFAIFAPKFNTYLAPPAAPRAAQPSSREPARALAPAPFSSRSVENADDELEQIMTGNR